MHMTRDGLVGHVGRSVDAGLMGLLEGKVQSREKALVRGFEIFHPALA